MSDWPVLHQKLRVAVSIPSMPPTSGGGFEFQHSIFSEILNRVRCGHADESNVHYVPVASCSGVAENWSLDARECIDLVPSRALRIQSALHCRLRRLRHPFSAPVWSDTLLERFQSRTLARHADVLWSLGPSAVVDQIPFILTVWDLQHRLQPFFPEVSRRGQWELRERFYSIAARKSFLNVVGTTCGSDELCNFYGIDQSRVLVSPFPCPPTLAVSDDLLCSTLARLGLQSREYLFYPAQFWSHKNHLSLLIALRRLVDGGSRLKLVLAGSDKGSLAGVNSIIANLGLGEWVVNVGFVDRLTLAALYSSSLCLVYPSFFGPDNIPPLEAMSYGVPALVADVPGCLEQFGDAVLRFDPCDPQQIVDCVLRILVDPGLRSDLSRKGFELVSSLTPAAYVDRVEEVLLKSGAALRCASI